MTVTKKKKTAPAIVRAHLGDDLTGLYVVTDDPVSGRSYDPLGLLALVDRPREDAYEAGGTLSTTLLEHGFEIPIKVLPDSERIPDDADAIEI
jgi:hypothetical protein